MVKETNIEGKIVFKCEKCGWLYTDFDIADMCQRWCEKHKSCNLKFQRYAIKINKIKVN